MMDKLPYTNKCFVSDGFLFTPDGLSLEEMAVLLHEEGYLSDDEMAEGGGVPALRRKLYDELSENRHHYSAYADRPFDEETLREKAEDDRLFREVNAYADYLGVNDPLFMDMIVDPEDLQAFGLKVNGKNIVDAELIAKAAQLDNVVMERRLGEASNREERIIKMVTWILAGRK